LLSVLESWEVPVVIAGALLILGEFAMLFDVRVQGVVLAAASAAVTLWISRQRRG
jgi:hypothetical protein